MQLGEAFITLSMQLPPSASKDVEKVATKTGQDAAEAFSKAADKATHIEAKGAFKDFPEQAKKAGAEAGQALGKAVGDAANKMSIKTPNLEREYAKAGSVAGEALSKAVDNAANKITLKTPNITGEYKTAGDKAGTALADSVNIAVKKVKVTPPDLAPEFATEGGKAGAGFGDKFKSATKGFGNFGSALGVQLITAFDKEADLSKTTRNFQNQLGATKNEAKGLGLAAGKLYADGLADGMDDAEQAITSTINAISGIRDAGGPAIAEIAGKALGLSKAFGQDLDGVLRATGQLMRTGLAKDGKEAMDIIAGGLQKIPGAAEDLLDTFTEYSVQFKKLGLDGKDALGLINQMVEGGARNTDLAADALKEFSIRAIDGSSATAEAFERAGLDALEMSRKFAAGGAEAKKAFGDVLDALNKMEDPLERNLAGADLFGSQWEDLGDAFRKADLKTATKELGDLNGVADQVGGNTFGEKFRSNLSKLQGVTSVIGGALGISFAASFDSAMDFKSSQEKLARDLGLTQNQAKEIGKAAGDLYSSGLGEGLADVTAAISEVGMAMPGIAKQGVPALKEVSEAALRLQKNFDVDITTSANAVGKMVKLGLVKDATEGFNLIAAGMKSIPRAGEDLLDTVNEYSVQFQKLGLSGRDTFGLIQQLMKAGARDTDLAADALKEFSIRAVDGSATSLKAFKDLGFNAKELTATFAKGGPEARKAFGDVVESLKKVEDPVKRNTIAVSLFGTQAEDLGKALYSMDLEGAAKGMGNLDTANKKVKESTPTEIVEKFKRSIETAFIETLANQVIPAFGKFIEFVKNNKGLLTTLAGTVAGLGVAYVALNTAMAISSAGGLLTFMKNAIVQTKAWTVSTYALGLAQKAMPLVWIVTAIAAVIAIIVLLYKNNETVRKAIDTAWAAIKKAIAAVSDWFTQTAWPAIKKALDALGAAFSWLWKNVIIPVWDGIRQAIVVVYNWFMSEVKPKLDVALKAIGGFFTWLWKTIIVPVWNGIKEAIKIAWGIIKVIFDAVSAAIKVLAAIFMWIWKNIVTPVWNGIKLAIQIAWVAIQIIFKAVQIAIKVLASIFEWLWKNIIMPVWAGIKLAIQIAWVAIQIIFKAVQIAIKVLAAVFEWLWKNIIVPVWDGIKKAIGVAWSLIKPILQAVWDFLKKTLGPVFEWLWHNVIGPVWEGIKKTIGAAWNFIRDKIFTPLKNFVTQTIPKAFSAAVNAIGKAWSAIQNAVKVPVEFVVNTVIRDGIVKAFNAVATKVGVSPIKFDGISFKSAPYVSQHPGGAAGFAGGGILPGYTPGRDVHMFTSPTGGRLALSGGEAVMRPEFTRALGTATVNRLNAAARSGGVAGVRHAMGYANGGVLRFAKGGVINTASVLWEQLTNAAGSITGRLGGWLGGIPKMGGWGADMLKHTVSTLVNGVGKFVTSKVQSALSSVGSVAGEIGNLLSKGNGAGYQWQEKVLKAAFPNVAIYSTTGGKHAPGSWHYRGRAVDITPSMAIFNWIRQNYGANTKELIYGPAGGNSIKNGRPHNFGATLNAQHMNHVHWAYKRGGIFKYDDGGWLEPGMTGINLRKRPEAVLTPEESRGLKNMGVGELVELLQELIDEVRQNGHTVGSYIRGSGAGLRAQGRSI